MSAALIFVGSLALINLLLLALLARRMRGLTGQPSARTRQLWLPPGSSVLDFEADAITGERVSMEWLRGKHSLVGIFSTTCEPCQEQVAVLSRQAEAYGGPGNILAVVVGSGEKADEFITQLEGKALLVREGPRGEIAAAFSVSALPALYMVDHTGKVVASGASLAAVSHARLDASAVGR